jgi:hypothetical protein
MVRPCVARDFLSNLVGHGSCINVSGLSLEHCSGPSWISARVRSRYEIGLNQAIWSPVFAYAGKTDPPKSSQILSQTSADEKVATCKTPESGRRIADCCRRIRRGASGGSMKRCERSQVHRDVELIPANTFPGFAGLDFRLVSPTNLATDATRNVAR